MTREGKSAEEADGCIAVTSGKLSLVIKKLLSISNYSSFSLTLPLKFRENIIDSIMKAINFAKVYCKVS